MCLQEVDSTAVKLAQLFIIFMTPVRAILSRNQRACHGHDKDITISLQEVIKGFLGGIITCEVKF